MDLRYVKALMYILVLLLLITIITCMSLYIYYIQLNYEHKNSPLKITD